MTFKIRRVMSFKDIRELVSVHNKVWVGSNGIIDLLVESTLCYVAVDEEKGIVVAYVFLEEDAARGFFELNDIAVAPGHRGRGLGAGLMRHVMERCPRIKLCARAKNKKLIRFYKRLGFEKEAVFENYYAIGDDALRMSWGRFSKPDKPILDPPPLKRCDASSAPSLFSNYPNATAKLTNSSSTKRTFLE